MQGIIETKELAKSYVMGTEIIHALKSVSMTIQKMNTLRWWDLQVRANQH